MSQENSPAEQEKAFLQDFFSQFMNRYSSLSRTEQLEIGQILLENSIFMYNRGEFQTRFIQKLLSYGLSLTDIVSNNVSDSFLSNATNRVLKDWVYENRIGQTGSNVPHEGASKREIEATQPQDNRYRTALEYLVPGTAFSVMGLSFAVLFEAIKLFFGATPNPLSGILFIGLFFVLFSGSGLMLTTYVDYKTTRKQSKIRETKRANTQYDERLARLRDKDKQSSSQTDYKKDATQKRWKKP